MGTHANSANVPGGVRGETGRQGEGEKGGRVAWRNAGVSPASQLERGVLRLISLFVFISLTSFSACSQNRDQLSDTIRNGTTEQKRDALFQIRNLKSEIASRTALPALTDKEPIVRATAASSVTFLPKSQAVKSLVPLLEDRDEFVRRETAYALGSIESAEAAPPLLNLLRKEKIIEVKSAAVVGLGQSGNPSAVEPLLGILKARPNEDTEFLRRSAARSIGRIAQIVRTSDSYVVTPQNFLPEKFKEKGDNDLTARFPVFGAAVVVLSQVLQNKNESDDARREAAFALGSIGSRSSITVLQVQQNSSDPYLAEISKEALLKVGKPE
jgi:HEAT repeat protein